jgi:hypothetical protein
VTTYRVGTSYAPTVSSCPTQDCGATVVRDYTGTTTTPSTGPQTFQENASQPAFGSQQNGGATQPSQNGNGLTPQPEASTGPSFMQPEPIRPNVSPTAKSPIRQALYYRPVSLPASSENTERPKVDVSGWHAARD